MSRDRWFTAEKQTDQGHFQLPLGFMLASESLLKMPKKSKPSTRVRKKLQRTLPIVYNVCIHLSDNHINSAFTTTTGFITMATTTDSPVQDSVYWVELHWTLNKAGEQLFVQQRWCSFMVLWTDSITAGHLESSNRKLQPVSPQAKQAAQSKQALVLLKTKMSSSNGLGQILYI